MVPPGRVTTYGGLAAALGDVIAARWVGELMMRHRHRRGCRCFRVVRADGSLGGYAGGAAAIKAARLRADGVSVQKGRVDLAQFGFNSFDCERPLEGLRLWQDTLAEHVRLDPIGRAARYVGGVDVSYRAPAGGDEIAIAVCAVCDLESGELVTSVRFELPAPMPYISTYLAFRELPAMASAANAALATDTPPDVLLVDGSGILHPRGAGVATHLGVVLGVPTIGVTKKHLWGQAPGPVSPAGNPAIITDGDGDELGAVLRPRPTSKRLLYVSPGHLADCGSAVGITKAMLRGRRLPEPIYWADRLSRLAAKDR